MKFQVLSVIAAIGFMSCGNETSGSKNIKPLSSGKLNNITVVSSINWWEGASGSAVRSIIGGSIYGLPQDEPMFDLYYMPQDVFSGFTRKNRTVLMLEKSDSVDVKVLKNVYAQPQTVVKISGPNDKAVAEQINLQSEEILKAFQTTEIREKQRQIGKSLNKNSVINNNLGLDINFPSAYRIASETEDFVWARRDIESGSVNFIVYELPESRFDLSEEMLDQVIAVRDSVGEKYIPGPIEGSFMITEKKYKARIIETQIDGQKAYETRSTWELANAFMAGPFINYTIFDPQHNRWLVAEGFVLAPSKEKRSYVLELEAILTSISIQN